MSVVLSVRVRKELKEKEREEINDIARKIKELMKDVSEEEWVEAIRGERNER